MGFYITQDGSYYEGDRQGYDQEVPQRPSLNHKWEAGVWVQDLNELKTDKKADIDKAREYALNAGVTYNNVVYDSDERSRNNLTGTVSAVKTLGISLPDGFTWRSQDNQNTTMTIDDLSGLAGAMLNHVNSTYAKSWELKAAVDSATTEEEINAVVWE